MDRFAPRVRGSLRECTRPYFFGLTFDLIYLSRGYMGVMLSIQHKARLSLEAVSAAAVQRNEHRIASLGTSDPHVGCEGIC